MHLGHSKIYRDLAVWAGRQADLADPTPESVAANASARGVRDLAWSDLERMLQDEQTHTLSAILEWLHARGVETSETSVHRAREQLRDRRRAAELAASRTNEIVRSLAGLDEHAMLSAAAKRAGQICVDTLSRLDAEALEDLSGGQIIGLVSVLSQLRRDLATVELTKARTEELKKKFEAAVERLKTKGRAAQLSPEDVASISETVFGRSG